MTDCDRSDDCNARENLSWDYDCRLSKKCPFYKISRDDENMYDSIGHTSILDSFEPQEEYNTDLGDLLRQEE